MNKNSKVTTSHMSKEEIEKYIAEKYPKGLPKSEQEIDREAAERRKIERGVNNYVDRLARKDELKKTIDKLKEDADNDEI